MSWEVAVLAIAWITVSAIMWGGAYLMFRFTTDIGAWELIRWAALSAVPISALVYIVHRPSVGLKLLNAAETSVWLFVLVYGASHAIRKDRLDTGFRSSASGGDRT